MLLKEAAAGVDFLCHNLSSWIGGLIFPEELLVYMYISNILFTVNEIQYTYIVYWFGVLSFVFILCIGYIYFLLGLFVLVFLRLFEVINSYFANCCDMGPISLYKKWYINWISYKWSLIHLFAGIIYSLFKHQAMWMQEQVFFFFFHNSDFVFSQGTVDP